MTIHRAIRAAFLVSMTLAAQSRFESLPVPSPASESAVDAAALEAKYPGMDAVYLERITDYENIVKMSRVAGYDWNLLFTEYRRFVVLDPEAEPYTTFSLELPANHELEKVSLAIWSPGGSFRTFGLKDLKEHKDSDGAVTYKFAFPGVVKGSVITQAYLLRRLYCLRDSPLNYSVGLQYRVPCEKNSFRVTYPRGWEMAVKKLGENHVLPVTVVEDKKADRTVLSYSSENVPAIQSEPFSPFYKEVAVYGELQIRKVSMRVNGWYPILYKAPKDWNALSQRVKEQIIDRDPLFSRRVGNETKEIIAGCTTDLEKLDAIISWTQSNMRWMSYADIKASGLESGNFAHILARKEGTDDQITALAMSMLLKAGIDTKFVVVHSAEDGYFDPGFFAYSQLNTSALLAQIDGKGYVVFPYWRQMPVDYVPEEYQGQKALAIDRHGNAEFIDLPLGSHAVNETAETYQITLQEDGKVRVEEERVLRGASAYSTRRNLAGLSYRDTENALKRMITFSEGTITLKSHAVIDQQDYKKPLKIQLEYELENLVTITPEDVVFNTAGLFSPISRIKAKERDRQNPIRIYNDETSRKSMKVSFPAAWTPSTALKDSRLDNRFGSIARTFRVEPGILTSELSLSLRKASEPKESYADLVALTGRKTSQAVPAIVFKVQRKP